MLKELKRLGATKVQIFTNSKPMLSQFGGTYDAKNEIMATYPVVLQARARHFTSKRLS